MPGRSERYVALTTNAAFYSPIIIVSTTTSDGPHRPAEPQRHSHANLVSALAHRISHYAIYADRSQRHDANDALRKYIGPRRSESSPHPNDRH